ncbi:MAG: PQQ-binding-like beta-propeller repeat protein [Caulobacteraceae bacterium]
MRTGIASALGAVLMASAALAQPVAPGPGDWPRYAHDLAGTRFSPLTQIDTGNVSKLATAWSFRVRPEGGGGIVTSATPVVVDGLLYLPIGNAVVALDPDTGQEVWRHPVTEGVARRAVSYWPGDRDHAPRIFFSNGQEPDRAERQDRRGRPRLRQGRGGGSWRALRLAADGLQERADRRRQCGGDAGRPARRQPRLRRAHRQAAVGVPHRAAAGRAGARHLAERRLEGPVGGPMSGSGT